MSIQVMTDIWRTCLYQGGQLLVLLALADAGDHNGENIFPSVEYLAAKCRQSVRATQDALKRLREDGIIIRVDEDGMPIGEGVNLGGRSRFVHYVIDLERVQELQGLHEQENPDCDACRFQKRRKKRMQNLHRSPTQTVQMPTRKGAESDSAYREPSEEPSLNSLGGESEMPLFGTEKTASPPVPTWDQIWAAFRRWPGFRRDSSEEAAKQAYQSIQLSKSPPTPAEMIAAIDAHGRWIEEENERRPSSAGPLLVQHPRTWLREGAYKGYLEQMAPKHDIDIELDRLRARIGHHVGRLLHAGIESAEILSWFADCEVVEDGKSVEFVYTKAFRASWVRNNYRTRLDREYGQDVVIRLAEEK